MTETHPTTSATPPLQGVNAIITGSAMGIGKAIATAYVRAGARVALFDRAEKDLTETVHALKAETPSAAIFPFVVDLADPIEVAGTVEKAIIALGSLQTIVSNAGILRTKPFEQTTLQDWDDHLNINLRAAFLLLKAAYPHFRALGGGVMLLTSSASGIRGFVNETAYTPSKHGLEGFMKAMSMELEPLNIRVNTVTPGHGTKTPLSEANYSEEEKKRWIDPIYIAPAWVELAQTKLTGQRLNAWEISERIRAEQGAQNAGGTTT
jgi:NAD(P)-dependent dehydrogenase (short-subunit alcohol dehydrogenase family)